MFCSPATIWRREMSVYQPSQSSWPSITKMHGTQRLLCFPEALQILMMRVGKFPSCPAPKALDNTEEDRVFSEYKQCLKKHLWFSLYCQVQASLEQSPSGEHEHALACRWSQVKTKWTKGKTQNEGSIYISAAGGPVGQGCCSGRAAGQQHSPWGRDGPRPSDGSAARPPGSAECNDCMQTPWAPVSSSTRRQGGGRGRGQAWLRCRPRLPCPTRSVTASGSAGQCPWRGCPQTQAAGRVPWLGD